MEIRFQFERREEIKFIGHLDIMRLFERAFKRAGIPIAHSGGFNPRPRIVFAQPMPLGLTSEGEFADVEIMETVDTKEFIKVFNESLPLGVRILDAKCKTNNSNLMGLIDAAKYRIDFETSETMDMRQAIQCVISRKQVNVMKKTKKGMKEINIRPLIYEMEGEITGYNGCFIVLLGAGQDNNVRPELFLDGVSKATDILLDMQRMHRIMLYHFADFCEQQKGSRWITPMHERLLKG